jgi:hypothetical protein
MIHVVIRVFAIVAIELQLLYLAWGASMWLADGLSGPRWWIASCLGLAFFAPLFCSLGLIAFNMIVGGIEAAMDSLKKN